MLVHIKEIVSQAIEGKYAVGAFNTMNLEITQGIIQGAKRAESPIIIQISENVINYAGLKAIYHLVKSMIEDESGGLPIAMHLDHGKDLELAKACVSIGFSSIHLDASALPFEENIKLTKEAVDYAHQHQVWAQGELGNILGKEGLIKFQQGEDIKKLLTRPEQIKEYIERTGVDTVAVSIGNVHGYYVAKGGLDLERLERINKEIKIPIVLHGGSGIPFEQLKAAIALGIRIINIDTNLRMAFNQALRHSLAKEKDLIDPREILKPAKEAITSKVYELIQIFKG